MMRYKWPTIRKDDILPDMVAMRNPYALLDPDAYIKLQVEVDGKYVDVDRNNLAEDDLRQHKVTWKENTNAIT